MFEFLHARLQILRFETLIMSELVVSRIKELKMSISQNLKNSNSKVKELKNTRIQRVKRSGIKESKNLRMHASMGSGIPGPRVIGSVDSWYLAFLNF